MQEYSKTRNVPVLIQRLAVVTDRQAIATTSVRSGRIPPGGEKGIARRLRWKQCVRIGDAPDSVNCSARRYLQLLEILRRLAPGGKCPPPSSLEVGNAWQYVSPTR